MKNALIVALFAAVTASTASSRVDVTPTITAAKDTFTVGMLRVEHSGVGGRAPLIFIPALFRGAWRWHRQIAALENRYEIYAVTLPGFDGRPRDTGGDLMNRAASDISRLIRAKKLDHPIIIGHSLGGTLAVLVGATYPGEVRGVIAAEGGYPLAPTHDAREQRVNASVAPYVGVTRAAFGDSLRKNMLRYVITAPADVDSMERLAVRRDPEAMVDWMRAALLLDLTPQLANIAAPFTEIVPFDSVIDPYQGHASIEAKRVDYAAWVGHAPHGSLVMIDHARHFVMVDQPAAFDAALFAAIEESVRPPSGRVRRSDDVCRPIGVESQLTTSPR